MSELKTWRFIVVSNALAAVLNLALFTFLPDHSLLSLGAGLFSAGMLLWFWRRKPKTMDEIAKERGFFKVDNMTDPWFGAQQGPGWLVKTHPPEKCAGRACVIHNPSDHAMRSWPLNWRADRLLMERTCSHGVGHPDPDDLAWHVSEGRVYQSQHGCDGCCHA